MPLLCYLMLDEVKVRQSQLKKAKKKQGVLVAKVSALEDAILHACPLRIRPILMTTLTTVLAMVPMALALGDTLEMMSDMGITMISGMVISAGRRKRLPCRRPSRRPTESSIR